MSQKRRTLVDIVEGIIGKERMERDELNKLEEEEERDLIKEYRRLKLRELVERKKKALKEIGVAGEEISAKEGLQSPMPNIVSSLITSLVAQGMKPEEINEFIKKLSPEVLAALSSVYQTNPNAGLMIALLSRNNPQQLTVKDVVEIADKMRGAGNIDMVKMFEVVANIMKSSQQTGTPVELFKDLVMPLMQEVYKTRLESLEKEIAQLRNRPGFLQEIAEKKDELEALRALLGAGGAKEDLEYKKLLLDHERWKTEKAFEIEKWKMEQGLSRDKISTVINKLIAPFMSRMAPAIEKLTTMSKSKVGTVPEVAVAEGETRMLGFKCEKCNNIIAVDKNLPEVVVCSNCGATYSRKPIKIPAQTVEPTTAPIIAPATPTVETKTKGLVKDKTVVEGDKNVKQQGDSTSNK